MASGSQNMTTYNARIVTGSNSAASPAGALLLSGAGRVDDATGDTWIFLNSLRGTTNPWGIKHDQANNKLQIFGSGTNSVSVRMNTGDTYILGKVGIGYDPETSGNTYKLYINGTSYFNDHIYLVADKEFYMQYNNTMYDVLHNHNNGNISVNAAGTGLYVGYYNTTLVDWMSGRMQLKDGCLSIFPNTTNYREGMRIHSVSSWSGITLCGNDNTGDTGISANSWYIGNNDGNLYIARNGNPGSTAYIGCVSNVWKVVTAADIPEGAANLSATASAHTLSIYRNGITIPYQGDNANDGGMLRVRGTAESNCIFELGTWDDSGAGETIQFNYYPTTSQVTPTYSVNVPKHSGTLVTTDGNGASGSWGISVTGNSATTSKLADSAHSWTATEVYNYMTARVLKAGDTMTGQLKTSFKSSVAIGSYCTDKTTVPNLVGEIRYSSGAMGSMNLTTAYSTTAGGSISTGWYNYIYSPHRSGGVNGAASGDNQNYGSLFLSGMTVGSNLFYIRVASGSIAESRRIWMAGNSVTSAVWNDYAEARASLCTEPGRTVQETGSDTLTLVTKRLAPCAGIVSDTWGFSQGETGNAKTHIAVAGRVLAYPYQPRVNYKPGDVLCAAPDGTVDIMTREEVIQYPDRIVGTVSCVPEYEEWGGGESADRPPVKVNGRIWIKVK